jgi:hypothetical protein
MSNDWRHAGAHHGRELAREDGDVLLLDRPAAQRRFFTLLTITPWRRRLALTMASLPVRIRRGPAAVRPAFPLEDDVLIRALQLPLPLPYAWRTEPRLSLLVCYRW